MLQEGQPHSSFNRAKMHQAGKLSFPARHGSAEVCAGSEGMAPPIKKVALEKEAVPSLLAVR